MKTKQKSLAEELGVSAPTISAWKAAGAPLSQGVEAVRAWRDATRRPYISGSQQAPACPPPADSNGVTVERLDLAQERAQLARAQRQAQEQKNALFAGQYAPVAMLTEVLAIASQSVAERFDQLPGQMRRACPLLPQRALDEVLATIASARNEWVRATSALLLRRGETTDDEPESSAPSAEPGAAP